MRTCLAALATALLLASAPAAAETVVITHARAVTMTDGGTLDDATIVIRDGRITAVGTETDAPDDARVIDAGEGS